MSPRVLALGALVVAAAALGAVALRSGSDDGYRVRLQLADAGGLLKGSNVRVDGAPVGKVTKLDIDRRDQVTAEVRLDHKVAPVGRDARAVVQVDGVFGERYIELERGDVRAPIRSGGVLPESHTRVAVRLDDVIDVADAPTREALGVFLREQGAALVGRGHDLASTLAAMPRTLDSATELIGEFAADNRALGRLVDSSDRVVSSVARERASLGDFVDSAGAAFDTLAGRRLQLGETVRRAPATMASARRALAELQGAAVPLIPAARGLRATAPQLTATLRELPGFAEAAVPTLATIRSVSPQLDRLGRHGTPVVQRLQGLAGDLATYGDVAGPFWDTLERETNDLFGVMEGWARATQPKDAASHVFRFGASTSGTTFAGVLPQPPSRKRRRERAPAQARPGLQAPSLSHSVPALPKLPDVRLPKVPVPRLPDVRLPKAPSAPSVPAPQAPAAPAAPSVPNAPQLPGVGGLAEQRRYEGVLDYLLGP